MEDSQATGGATENGTQDNQRIADEMAALKAQIEALTANQFQAQAAQVEAKPQLTADQAAALAANPALMANWLQSQAENAVNEIKKESQKQIHDAKAYEKFPLLNTDKEFEKRVVAQMREMVSGGEYAKNDPKLLYRAAQIAAAEYAPSKSNASKTAISSVETRMTSQQSRSQQKAAIPDDDQQMVFGRMLIGDDKEKLERFRASLKGPFEGTTRRPTRRFVK